MDVFELDRLTCGRDDPTNNQNIDADLDGTRRSIIPQDVPAALSYAILHPRIEPLAHDLWNPQPTKGASFYYMRNVLQDHPDDKCVQLLRLQGAAMATDGSSNMLINEIVHRETGAGPRLVEIDIAMMACLAASERTKDEWGNLVRAARLSLVETFTYATDLG
ncbi:hypothetical protein ASPFODRAFT_35610 [Aspergillus luchuensis CBS 106.47]|uniref:O-methyltransferase C-terminal domain-containing protein n=1 Tax=Aspergillus luchuensis (strain CBS 106.47) TaxID=1137211 RepID=A0A1M3T8F6_ASPLC|nr:hypothetical protein ASPFODRAFT_35610 [Aspergillus luchuensis CBS 106.47]